MLSAPKESVKRKVSAHLRTCREKKRRNVVVRAHRKSETGAATPACVFDGLVVFAVHRERERVHLTTNSAITPLCFFGLERNATCIP